MGRKTRLAAEGAKFTAVNIVATAVALVGFNLLTHGVIGWFAGPMNQRPLSAYVVANSVGMLISFFGIRHYVYKHRKPMGPGGGFVNYCAVNLASFVLPVACLWVTRNIFDWDSAVADNISGNIVGATLATLIRFWAFRVFVFRTDSPKFGKGAAADLHLSHVHWRPGRHHAPVTGADSGPEVGPDEAELFEHQSQQRQADADHVVRIPGEPRHERPSTTVEGEGSGDSQRLA